MIDAMAVIIAVGHRDPPAIAEPPQHLQQLLRQMLIGITAEQQRPYVFHKAALRNVRQKHTHRRHIIERLVIL